MDHDGAVRAATSLQPYLTGCAPAVARFGLRLEFDDPTELVAKANRTAAILLPATNSPETDLLRSLRAERFLLPVAGVVSDRTGHQTYLALRAGATAVINLLLPVQHRVEALQSVLEQARRASPTAGGPALGPALRAVATPIRDGLRDPRETEVLIDLLCGPHTVSLIARRFFCSERSMYRRIRRLYDEAGVTGRAELRAAVALHGYPAQAKRA
ncbi:MAG: hypothetical protein ACRDRH_23545 [Pseudonocardia sp.]